MNTGGDILPRLSDDLVFNNVGIVVIATVAAVVGLSLTLAITHWFVRRAAQASRVEAIEEAVAKAWRPVRLAATLVSLLWVLAAAGVLAYAIWKAQDLQLWVDRIEPYLTPEVLLGIAQGVGVVFILAIGFRYARSLSAPLVPRIERRLLTIEALEGLDEPVGKFVGQLQPLVTLVLAYVALLLGASWLALPESIEWLITTVVYVLLVLNGSRTLALVVQIATESIDRLAKSRLAEGRPAQYYDGIRGLWPLARRSFEAMIYIAAATLIVREIEALEPFEPYGPMVIQLITIFFFSKVLVELSRVLVGESMSRSATPLTDEAVKRRSTLIYLVQSLVKWLLYFGAALWMLEVVGLDPTPILAGAGIVGLTVGLGAQKLVNDLVSGFFILFEGQMLNGDYVKIGDAEGIVEGVYLRNTHIRDMYGRVHIMRNGDIQTVINYSKGWTYALVEMKVAYESDLDRALQVIEGCGERLMATEPELVLERTEVLGVEKLGESSIQIRTITKVQPGMHREVKRALNKLLRDAFVANSIEIPYPKAVEIQVDL